MGYGEFAVGRRLMTTAAVSSSSIYQELQSFYQSRQSDLKQLGSALQSGDLNGAQQVYNALAALGQSGPFANSETFSKSSKDQALEAIGQALQSGDLAGAPAAFATLTGKQSSAAASATPAAILTLTSTQPATTTATDGTLSIYEQIQAYRQQKQADVTQLGQDLKAGNLTAAQQDFNTLTALGQSGPSANGQVFQRADRTQDFQAIGSALQSGDLTGAQSDFANLSATFGGQSQVPPAVGPAPIVPPVVKPPVSVGPEPVVPPVSASSTTPEIVINLGQGGSSSSGVNELVINLGEASSTTASSAS